MVLIGGLSLVWFVTRGSEVLANYGQRVGWLALPCIAAWLLFFWRTYKASGVFGKLGGPQITHGLAFIVDGPAGTQPISMAEYARDVALYNSSEFSLATGLFITIALVARAKLQAASEAE